VEALLLLGCLSVNLCEASLVPRVGDLQTGVALLKGLHHAGHRNPRPAEACTVIVMFSAVLRIHDILVWIRIQGSKDPCLRAMDPDQDPAIFVINLQDANKKTNLKKGFLLITF
jgi:hypothetical protein